MHFLVFLLPIAIFQETFSKSHKKVSYRIEHLTKKDPHFRVSLSFSAVGMTRFELAT